MLPTAVLPGRWAPVRQSDRHCAAGSQTVCGKGQNGWISFGHLMATARPTDPPLLVKPFLHDWLGLERVLLQCVGKGAGGGHVEPATRLSCLSSLQAALLPMRWPSRRMKAEGYSYPCHCLPSPRAFAPPHVIVSKGMTPKTVLRFHRRFFRIFSSRNP